MAIDYTTDALVDSVKRRITVPTSQQFFYPANIVNFANDEMMSTMVPAIIAVMEEYFVTKKDYAIVSGVTAYEIPNRAVGGMMRDVVLVDNSGNEVSIPRLQPESTKSESALSNTRLYGFILRDDKIVLYPSSDAFTNQAYVRVYYMRRPNNLVIKSLGAQISNVNTGTNEVTLSNVPSSWTTSTIFDVIQGNPIFSSVADDQAITTIAGNILTFVSLPTGIASGQWVAEARNTPIPQIPYEGHHVLAQFTAARMLEAMGDKANAQVILAIANNLLEGFLKIITPRTEATMKKINSRAGVFAYTGQGYFDLRA